MARAIRAGAVVLAVMAGACSDDGIAAGDGAETGVPLTGATADERCRAGQGARGLFEAEGRGTFWDLCMGQLEVAFQTAIEGSVDAACQELVPQG